MAMTNGYTWRSVSVWKKPAFHIFKQITHFGKNGILMTGMNKILKVDTNTLKQT